MGGCRAIALAFTGSYRHFDPAKCAFFKGGYMQKLDALFQSSPRPYTCLSETGPMARRGEPEKLPQIRRFLNYFLPTTLKILNAYDRMDAVGISGDNIDTTKAKVEAMMGTIVKAFDKQLDSLFGAEAMDISTDITVMENLLAQEGLSGPERPKTSGGGTTLEL